MTLMVRLCSLCHVFRVLGLKSKPSTLKVDTDGRSLQPVACALHFCVQ